MKKILITIMAIVALGWGTAWGSDVKADKSPQVERTMTIRNEEGQLSSQTYLVDDLACTFVIGQIVPPDPMRLWMDLKILKSRAIKKLHVYIDSSGGLAFSGLSYASQLITAWPDFEITTYAMGYVASAALPIFLAGEKRVASTTTLFMVHKALIRKPPTQESQADLRAQTEMLDLIETNYNNILVQRSNLSLVEISEKTEKTTHFSAQQAKEWGMVDEIQ